MFGIKKTCLCAGFFMGVYLLPFKQMPFIHARLSAVF
jgi:hypothetical protein